MQDLLTRLLLAGGGGFSPSALFGGGAVQGAWYDPGDFGATGTGGVGTLFQDDAGTTPVTAVEQPVGLVLDKSKGLVLGSELFSTFGTVTAPWTAQGGGVWSIDGSQAGSRDLSQAVQYTVGRFYVTRFTLSGVTGGTVTVFAGEGSVGPTYGNGTFTIRSYSSQAYLIFRAPAGVAATVSGISVRELSGNHAYQTTSASRPTLRARYNLLTRSEEFNDAYWARFSTSITTNAAIAPDGTTTADLLVPVTTGIDRWIYRGGFDSSVKTYSVYAKASGMSWMNLANSSGAGGGGVWFDLTNGVLGTVSAGFTASITSVGDGWYRCSTTQSGSNGANFIIGVCDSDNTRTATASGSNGILIWGAQLTATAVFPTNTYQRIGAATDYATGAAFPPYLAFDGVDDSMLTNSVDFATVTSDGQARRNLLLNPTQFDAAGWTPVDATITANAGVAPDGSTTADKFTPNNTIVTAYIVQSGVPASAGTYTVSVYAKAVELTAIRVGDFGNPTDGYGHAVFNLSAGTVTSQTNCTATITNADNGWYRCAITRTLTSGTSNQVQIARNTVTGNGTNGVLIWGAQLETGSTATAFQNIGTDKMLVVAGVTKQSDATAALLVELSATVSSNNGSFWVAAPVANATANYEFRSKGTAEAAASYSNAAVAAPRTNVVSGIGDIGADTSLLRVNGAQVASSASDQGTGNYGNYPIFIGRRNNATVPFNGSLFSLIIAGQSYAAGQITSTEQWVAARTPLGSI